MKPTNYILLFLISLGFSFTAISQPRLSSHPSAAATIYLDFDGQYVHYPFWNNNTPINAAHSGLTNDKITEIFHRVAEDFRPFDVNITTDSTVFLNAPLNMRVRVIVTPTSAWSPGVGGVSYIGSFVWGDDAPVFVFPDRLSYNSKYIAECISHETGHAIGLSHQSTYDENCELIETYAMGTGTGETSWSPIMGNSYYRNMTGWNDGPTPYGCALVQDNLTIITTYNGFGYRQDDHANAPNEAATFVPANFSVEGIISTNTDKDAFRYYQEATGYLHLEVKPFGLNNSNNGANLDVKVELADYMGNIIAVYDPLDKMSVSIDTVLNSGMYYIIVSGAGNANTGNYGSLGSYTITGARGTLPIHDIRLNGNADGKLHLLNWNIVVDEEVVSQELQYSTDGVNFNTLTNVDVNNQHYSYMPNVQGNVMYRLKIKTSINQIGYSNTIALRAQAKLPLATVNTLVQDLVIVQANEAYRFILTDLNGRVIATGKGNPGAHNIRMGNQPSGMYILKMISDNQQQVERIIKQ
jgi:hypothetical protein